MRKFRNRMSNYISKAKWNRVPLTADANKTTNSCITDAMFKRECKEYDSGTLVVHHELYIGERL